MNKQFLIKCILTSIVPVLAALSCIGAPAFAYEGGALFLQHLGTLLLVLLMLFSIIRIKNLPMGSFICLFIFVCLHILGARYLYSNVPYAEWAKQFFGWNIETASIHGNKYDRLVHFSFGLTLLPLLYHATKHYLPQQGTLFCLFFSWLCIQTSSMFYELFEWILSLVLSPENAEGYNGQQGDIWDAQKDMAWALIGSAISCSYIFIVECIRHKQSKKRRRTAV